MSEWEIHHHCHHHYYNMHLLSQHIDCFQSLKEKYVEKLVFSAVL